MPWWNNSVVYQVYPRSFFDTDGDGIGDLKGVTAKLDHIAALGADVIWLCPVYRSPNDDGGYDISDYRAIAPEFGTLHDFDEMLAAMHARGLKLIMDLVVNHTSDEHPWFQESKKGRTLPDGSPNLYRDYYLWKPGKEGPDGHRTEPNNWGSHFGGSAWKYDEHSGEYFLHLFSERQPDLNWEHPEVRREVFEMMRWWLDKGIDGFRMDTINMLSKPPAFPDGTPRQGEAYPLAEEHFLNGPNLHSYLQEMKREVLSKYDLLTVGETPGVSPEMGAQFTHPETGTLSMIFQFEHMGLDADPGSATPRWTKVPWALAELKRVTGRWQHGLHGQGWNSLYLSNHDTPRLVSRFGDDGEYRVRSAKLLATFLHTLQGTPYVYQGDEIGMTDVQFASIEDYRDVDALNLWQERVGRLGQPEAEVLSAIYDKGRDNARTPVQWTPGAQAGFTTGTPWIAVNPNFEQINVEAAMGDPASVFWYYRDLIALRRAHPVIVDGRYDLLLGDHPQVFAYTRTLPDARLLVLLNFSREAASAELPADLNVNGADLLLANTEVAAAPGSFTSLTLQPYEARVYLLGRSSARGRRA